MRTERAEGGRGSTGYACEVKNEAGPGVSGVFTYNVHAWSRTECILVEQDPAAMIEPNCHPIWHWEGAVMVLSFNDIFIRSRLCVFFTVEVRMFLLPLGSKSSSGTCVPEGATRVGGRCG